MIRISVDDLIALQRYTIYNNERLNYDVFWFNYGRKAQKTTYLIFLLQMSTVTMAERQIEMISVIFVIFCAYFYFESRKKVEIG